MVGVVGVVGVEPGRDVREADRLTRDERADVLEGRAVGASTTKYWTVPSVIRTATLRFSAEAGIVSAVAKAAARAASRQRVWIGRFIIRGGTCSLCVSAVSPPA